MKLRAILILAALILSVFAWFVPSSAQALPVTKTAQWDPNPSTDQVTKYVFQYDANTPIDVPTTIDAACQCIQQSFTVTATGNHNLSVIAVNAWGSSTPTVLSFSATIPGKSLNLRIK